MKTFKTIILVLIILLGASAGIAKVMLVPDELAFFKSVGLSENLLILFGIVQLFGCLLVIFKKSRKSGAIFEF